MTTAATLQDHLEQALRGARFVDDRETASHVRDEGRRLAFLLSGLVRAARLYAADNDALAGPSEELAEVTGALIERLGVVSVVLVEDQAYLNDVRLRVRPTEQAIVDRLAEDFGRHEAGGLTLHQRLDAAAWRRLAAAVAAPGEGDAKLAALRSRLAEVGDVEVPGPWRFRIGEEPPDGPESHGEVLRRLEAALGDTLARLGAGWMPNPLRVRRVVIDLVESLASRPDRAALAPFAGREGTSERHLVSVCQLSLLLGRALGLGDAVLSDLGVTALLHDVGYLVSLHPERHALAGARLLLRQRGFSEAKLRRLRAVLEHHAEGAAAEGPGLFARILHLADDYDLLVAWRADALPPVSPATALARFWAGRGTRHDPHLVALLARALGLYPPGTILSLTDGSRAVVVRSNPGDEGWEHPAVHLVRAADGAAVEETTLVDLRERGDDLRVARVARVVEPSEADAALVAAARAALASASA